MGESKGQDTCPREMDIRGRCVSHRGGAHLEEASYNLDAITVPGFDKAFEREGLGLSPEQVMRVA